MHELKERGLEVNTDATTVAGGEGEPVRGLAWKDTTRDGDAGECHAGEAC